MRFIFFFCLLCLISQASELSDSGSKIILILGAPGEEQYASAFKAAAEDWKGAAVKATVPIQTIGDDATSTNDLVILKQSLADQPKSSPSPLWLALIGHGAFDGHEAKFNLRGPDLTATEFAKWLAPFDRPLVIINGFSSSAPFLTKLARTNRIVITATRSGSEQNYSRFGLFFAKTISDSGGDIDKDGQVSVLEAFLSAARLVEEYYKTENRLATEHALIDDNGDGLGTPASFFSGVRATKKPAPINRPGMSANTPVGLDGFRAHQIHLLESEIERKLPVEIKAKRNALELQIEALREKKKDLGDSEYYSQLEKLMLQLSRLYQAAEKSETQ